MMVVMNIINPILIKIAITLCFMLPLISPGAFKKVPTTTAGAYSKYPRKYSTPKGTTIPTPSRIPRSKLVLFRNNSNCLNFSFRWFIIYWQS
jgi:hypothetical protein